MKRRSFIKHSAAAVSGLTLSGCTTGEGPAPSPGAAARATLGDTLEAVGRVVLPAAELGDAGIASVVSGFRSWLEGFEPVAELDHVYIYTDEIPYGPPDPAPRWASQLEALELESKKRFDAPFGDLSEDDRRAMIARQLPRNLSASLPDAAEAEHVAIGLLAYFYQSSEANDLCYGRAIEKRTCRGLDTASEEPRA